MIDYKPIDFDKTFPLDYKSLYPDPFGVDDYFKNLYERCANMYKWSNNGKPISEYQAKLMLNSVYGKLAIPEKEKTMREFITLHDVNSVVLIRKSSITHIYENMESVEVLTCVYTKGGCLNVKENVYDIIEKLSVKEFLFIHINNKPAFIKYCDICAIAPFDDSCYITTKHTDFTSDESYREILLKIQENSILW